MNRLLSCPHCGPTLTRSRLRCDRCGRELVYVSEAEFTGREPAAQPPGKASAAARHNRLLAGAAAAAVTVAAMAGLWMRGGLAPPAAPPDAPRLTTAWPQATVSEGPSGIAGANDSRPPAPAPEPYPPGDLGQALGRYRAALADSPSDAVLLDHVGQILVNMDRPADAVPFLEQAVEAEPFSVVARFDLAVAYARSGKPKEAVAQYQALIESGSDDIRVQHNLGLSLRQLGRNAEAAAAFKRAADLEPGRAPSWLGLALSLEADGRAAEAAAALEQYVALEPSRPDADNARARIVRLRSAPEPSTAQPVVSDGPSRRRP